MKKDKEKTSSSLLETIASPTTSDTLKEYAEVGIDYFIEDGAYKDIPIFNTIISVCKIGISISDHRLMSKISKFIYRLSDVSVEERSKTLNELENDEKYRRKIGEFLLEILDKVESEKKPEILAKIFKAKAQNTITVEMFYRLCKVAESVSLIDLPELRRFLNSNHEERLTFDEVFLQSLVYCGLAKSDSVFEDTIYTPNKVYEKFIELNLDHLE